MIVFLIVTLVLAIGGGLLLGVVGAVVVLFQRWLTRRPRYIDQEARRDRR